jgi:hypothetical protein
VPARALVENLDLHLHELLTLNGSFMELPERESERHPNKEEECVTPRTTVNTPEPRTLMIPEVNGLKPLLVFSL